MWAPSDPIGRSSTPSAARSWRAREGRYRLLGNACEPCGLNFLPSRLVCLSCRTRDLVARQFCRTGVVEVVAVDRSPLVGHGGRSVRPFAIVRLDDGPAVMTELVEVERQDIAAGMRVEGVIRKWRREATGLYAYGFKFRPVLS